LLIGLVSAAAWLTADALGGQVYSQPIIRYWNTAVRLGFFVVITLLLPALKELEREKQNARIDYLTGAANRRFFFEVFQRELDRAQRYQRPLTIAFIDLDEFKVVNDQLGHQVGDQILCNVVARISAQLRKTDLLARIGGDEFIILLPETDQDLSHTIISRIQSGLANEMQSNRWPVTFSIGVVTTSQIAITPDALIKQADAIMYSVKRGGKNAVAYAAQVG
jgi:diguanylate cyclase (GGDEF)-like protein